MSHKQFHVSDTNPNDTTGGGGCICDPVKQPDCKPPYVIFYGNDMESPQSPHVVACASCLAAANEAIVGEVLAAGESSGLIVLPVHAGSGSRVDLPAPVVPDDDEDLPEV